MDKSIEARLERIEMLLAISTKEVFNVHEAAAFIGVSENRLYHLASAKEVPYHKRGNSSFFLKSELEDWMTDGSTRVSTSRELRIKAAAVRPKNRQR